MKTKILPVIFVFIGFSCFAQGPILTMLNSGPEPGDILHSINADTTGVLSGPGGENQVWDFSNLVIGTATHDEVYGSVSLGYIKDATVTMGISFVTYLEVNDAVYSILGDIYTPVPYMAPTSELLYSLPLVLFTYPLIFSNSFTVPVEGTYEEIGFIDYYRKGTSTTTADGYGTLKVPSGTFKNVLRLKIIQDFRDSVLSISNPPDYSIALTHNEIVYWYDGFHKTPVLNIQQSSYTTNDTTYYTKSVLVGEGVNGINYGQESNVTFDLYPDPAINQVNLTFTLSQKTDIGFSILTMTGKDVLNYKAEKYDPGQSTRSLDVSLLPRGLYMVKLSTSQGNVFRKLLLN